MSCDLTSGRLLNECSVGKAGIKELYFTPYADYAALTGITESGGEITSLGSTSINVYQFSLGNNVGNFDEAATVAKDNGVSFITQTITLTLANIKPADLENLNNLKKGRWVIWALDYVGKLRMFGRSVGCATTGGSDMSGQSAGDKKGLDMVFTAYETDYAPFMADYTTTPFDNFTNVTVVWSSDGYGAELHTLSNAAADPNGTEANATTGFTSGQLTGTGANVFQSQSSVRNAGTYAFEADANDTPTAHARFYIDLSASPFSLLDGDEVKIEFDIRHVGTGDGWAAVLSSVDYGTSPQIDTVGSGETTFKHVSYEFTYAVSSHRYFIVREQNASNNGGVYFDNLSIKKKL